MSRYASQTPMDFTYDNRTGPMDGRSPFATVSANSQRLPPSPKKGPFASYNSPGKSPGKSKTIGSLSSSPSKPLPAAPINLNTLYNTPRRLNNDIDDSSAGETPRSEGRDDSDATPDHLNLRSAQNQFDEAPMPSQPGAEDRRGSPRKERPRPQSRDSLFAKIKEKFHSPGRGELPRKDHAGGIEKSISKRRKRQVDRQVARKRRHSMSDSGEDNDHALVSPRKTSGQAPGADENKPHWLGSFFTFISQHPTVPHILSFYAQLMFNIFLLLCCGYLIYCFWSAVQGDIDKKAHEAVADVMAEIAACAQQYQGNNCDRSTRMPALEAVCENWSKCMNRDPSRVGRAKVSAHTFAEIFNSFVEPISWKAMVFTFVLVAGCFATSNLAFGFFRSKTQEYQPNYAYGPPPPTPQRTFSGQNGAFYAGTPWQQPPQQLGFEPQPSGGFDHIEGQGSPVRRLAYH